jgi:solute carrier family 35 protein E3
MMSTTIGGFSVKTIVYMAFNFFSSVIIIVLNKAVFVTHRFNYATFLTVIHFMFTFLGLHWLAHIGHFEIKRVRIRAVLPLVFAFCGFVVFNNLSLQYNSVGCYQLMKVMTTPVVAIIQTVWYNAPLDNRLKISLIPICVGVCLATVNDIELTGTGLMYGVLGLLSTSFYQIWVKARQQDLGLNSYQLLYYQAPLSAVVVLFFVPVFDQMQGPRGLLEFVYSAASMTAIFGTALLAFCVNLSIYLVIGNTSPLSYNVLGHFKLCVILLSGWLIFGEDMNNKKLTGTFLAFVGVVLYTHLKQNIENEWTARKPAAPVVPPGTAQYTPVPQEPPSSTEETNPNVNVEIQPVGGKTLPN